MLKFKDAEQLAFYMIDEVWHYTSVTAFLEKNETIDLMKEFLMIDDDLRIGFIDIDSFDYDREYFVTISFDQDCGVYELSVEKAFNYKNNTYLGMCGYILFPETDHSAEAIIDITFNAYGELEARDWISLGEAAFCDDRRDINKAEKHHEPKEYTPESRSLKKDKEIPTEKSPDKNKASCKKDTHTSDESNKKKDLASDLEADHFNHKDAVRAFNEMEEELQKVNEMFAEMNRFRELLKW